MDHAVQLLVSQMRFCDHSQLAAQTLKRRWHQGTATLVSTSTACAPSQTGPCLPEGPARASTDSSRRPGCSQPVVAHRQCGPHGTPAGHAASPKLFSFPSSFSARVAPSPEPGGPGQANAELMDKDQATIQHQALAILDQLPLSSRGPGAEHPGSLPHEGGTETPLNVALDTTCSIQIAAVHPVSSGSAPDGGPPLDTLSNPQLLLRTALVHGTAVAEAMESACGFQEPNIERKPQHEPPGTSLHASFRGQAGHRSPASCDSRSNGNSSERKPSTSGVTDVARASVCSSESVSADWMLDELVRDSRWQSSGATGTQATHSAGGKAPCDVGSGCRPVSCSSAAVASVKYGRAASSRSAYGSRLARQSASATTHMAGSPPEGTRFQVRLGVLHANTRRGIVSVHQRRPWD